MVKFSDEMNSTELQVMPAPPSLMKALMAGFDAVSNQISLIFFSVTLDLLLWLGPRLRLTELLRAAFEQPAGMPEASSSEMLDVLLLVIEEFNLFSMLRTFPVGVPSLMASRSPIESPLGEPATWSITSLGGAFGLWLLFVGLGLAAATLYFLTVSQAALSGKVVWRQALNQWPWASLQVFLLMVLWLALIFSAFIPFTCFLSFFLAGGVSPERFTIFAALIFGGLLIWLLIPLVFSPHGIFVKRHTMWTSLRKSVRVTRSTLPSTVLFFLVVFVLSEGLRFLWNVPSDDSWWTLVGMAGHAFVTTSLLAASFIYYRDAEHWLQKMLQRAKSSVA